MNEISLPQLDYIQVSVTKGVKFKTGLGGDVFYRSVQRSAGGRVDSLESQEITFERQMCLSKYVPFGK